MAKEYTIVIVKPDGVKGGHVEPIKQMLIDHDYKILDHMECEPTRFMIQNHLRYDAQYEQTLGDKIIAMHERKNISMQDTGMEGMSAYEIGSVLKESVINYHMSGVNVAFLVQGENAIKGVKELCGSTFPADSAPDTIRGMFGEDSFEVCMRERRSPQNIAHAADSEIEAEHQIPLWFEHFEPKLRGMG